MDLRTLARAYDRTADAYDEPFRALQRPKYRAAAQLLEQAALTARLFSRGGLLLDAGAGTGLFAEWLQDAREPHAGLRELLWAQREQGRFIALDASVGMLRRARARNLPALAADLARPPLAAGSCALVLSFTALLENVPESLRALGALLRPGGMLCATFLQSESPAPGALARWSGLTPLAPPLAAGQDLAHLLQYKDGQ